MPKRFSDTVTTDINSWPSAIPDGLNAHRSERFEALQTAMRQYFDGAPTKDIQDATGVAANDLHRLAKKCLTPAGDGRIFGFRALLPYSRAGLYRRSAKEAPKRQEQQGGQTGMLGAMLRKHPDLEAHLTNEILQKSKRLRTSPHKLRAKDLHQVFLEYLKNQGAPKNEWPFTTKHLGARSISTYMKKVRDSNFGRSVTNWGDRVAKAHLNVGTGSTSFMVYEEPYDVVEIDAYHIDCHSTVVFETPKGDETDLLIQRLWLIVAVDRRTTAVLAYTIVYRSEVSADDVLRVIRKAATEKWVPIENNKPGYRYGLGAGLPSGVIEACHGAVWSVTMLDGALAHLALAVRERARKTLGFVLNWGPVGHFERRPNVERTFKRIAQDVFHLLPSTTGSNPSNGRAENAEQKAIHLQIRAEDIEPIVDVYFAQHNATPTEGQFNRSPLEVLAYYLEGPTAMSAPRKLPKSVFESTKTLACRETATVRGNLKNGRRPYIQIDRVHYTSTLLTDSGQLIGQKLVVDIDEEDMRQVKVYLSNGEELGFLQAHGNWAITKHSRKTRKAINSLLYRRLLILSEFDNPVLAYLRYLSTPKDEKRRQGKQVLPTRDATVATRVAQEADARRRIENPAVLKREPKTVRKTVTSLTLVKPPALVIGKVRNRR
jgi:putative transposase